MCVICVCSLLALTLAHARARNVTCGEPLNNIHQQERETKYAVYNIFGWFLCHYRALCYCSAVAFIIVVVIAAAVYMLVCVLLSSCCVYIATS